MYNLTHIFKNVVTTPCILMRNAYSTVKDFLIHPTPVNALLKAIQFNELGQLETLLQKNSYFDLHEQNVLLSASIKIDNMDIFKIVLKGIANDSVNYCLNEHQTIWESDDPTEANCVYTAEKSFLYVAIDMQAVTIAKWLATNPKTNFEYSGFSQVGSRREELCRPLDKAQENGLKEVCRILMGRMQKSSQRQALMHDLRGFDL